MLYIGLTNLKIYTLCINATEFANLRKKNSWLPNLLCKKCCFAICLLLCLSQTSSCQFGFELRIPCTYGQLCNLKNHSLHWLGNYSCLQRCPILKTLVIIKIFDLSIPKDSLKLKSLILTLKSYWKVWSFPNHIW